MILFCDNHILVASKPAGMLTQKNPLGEKGLEDELKQWVKTTYQKPGNVFLHAVHRLDRPVSGIVLFARTSKALSRLSQSTRERKYKKTYLALVEGKLSAESGVLEHKLMHGNFRSEVATSQVDDAKYCRLTYTVKQTYDGSTLVEISLETGRYHQIRAQFAESGHPIVGDIKYGSHFPSLQQEAIALHHSHLEIHHPVSGNLLSFEAPLPDYWPLHT